MNKELVQITDMSQVKVGTVIQEGTVLRMVLKIEESVNSYSKHYYVSHGVKITDVEQTPQAIVARRELKVIQYLYSSDEFINPSFRTFRVTFKN
jgi:hypothetical protein